MNHAARFLYTHRFALAVWAAWLILQILLVLAAQALHGRPLALGATLGDWDAGWYKSIVENGYYAGIPTAQQNVAFFPVYPLLVWIVKNTFLLPTVWAGALVSWASFAGALVLLYKLIAARYNPQLAKTSLLLCAFNPFSLYFAMMYTEALFLLLAVATFWFLHQKQWWLAALAAGLASGTRSVGFALGLVVIVAWAMRYWQKLQILRIAALGLVSVSGLLAFMAYLYFHTGNAVAFSVAQQFWPGREAGTLGVFIEAARAARLGVSLESVLYIVWYAATAIVVIGLVLLLRARQWLPALYTAIAGAMPLIFGTVTAMNRYALVLFWLYPTYGRLLRGRIWLRITATFLCFIGMALFAWFITNPRHPFLG